RIPSALAARHEHRCATRFDVRVLFTNTSSALTYTLSLHDALPISRSQPEWLRPRPPARDQRAEKGRADLPASQDDEDHPRARQLDRKSTRLNSSHVSISYAVFCLKKKKPSENQMRIQISTLMHLRS